MSHNIDLNSIQNKIKVNASCDGDKNELISKSEANVESIFTQASASETIDALSSGLDTNMSASLKNALKGMYDNAVNAFSEFSYNSQEVDSELEIQQKSKIDEQVNAEIKRQANEIKNLFESAAKAKAREFGVGREDDNQNFKYTSAQKGAATQTDAYQQKLKELKEQGYKFRQREVNGEKVTVSVKDGKEYVVDDSGNLQELFETEKGNLFRKSKYTFASDLRAADLLDENGNLREGHEVERRKVDGRYQTVVTSYKDDGSETSEVIEHDNVTGESSSGFVSKIESRGKDKFASLDSGLAANDNMGKKIRERGSGNETELSDDVTDDVPDDDARVRTIRIKGKDDEGNVTSYRTLTGNRARMNADAEAQNAAIQSTLTTISDALAAGRASFTAETGGTVTFKDGVQYTIKAITADMSSRQKREIAAENDRTLRMINNHYAKNYKDKHNETTIEIKGQTVQTTNIDNRGDASYIVDGGSNADDTLAQERPAQHYGSNYSTPDANGKMTASSGGAKPNKIHYDSGFTRANFQNEGWKRSAGGIREKGILDKMKAFAANPSNGAKFTSASNVTEFTTTYAKAMYPGKNIDINKLANAIKIANPSFFDANGNMYKNVDFNRINFPSDIRNYLKR